MLKTPLHPLPSGFRSNTRKLCLLALLLWGCGGGRHRRGHSDPTRGKEVHGQEAPFLEVGGLVPA